MTDNIKFSIFWKKTTYFLGLFSSANTSLDELMMSLINGYEVFEQAKNIEVRSEVCIILILVLLTPTWSSLVTKSK